MIKEKSGSYPQEYKKYELNRIDRLFTNIAYKGKNYLDFISTLVSYLIVTHGLTNTNHRTTIMFTSILLKKMKIDFPNYDSSQDPDRWIDDWNRFIEGSKKILSKRKSDPEYKSNHLEWTREWLREVTDYQSMSSGMMSFHLLTSLRKISSSGRPFSPVIK